MKRHTMLILASLLEILLLVFHYTDDVLREGGIAVHRNADLTAVPILGVLLCGTLLLDRRRSGYLIMLVLALGSIGMPVLHIGWAHTVIANELARARGDYFFVWGLFMLGMLGLFSLVLSLRCLINPEWGQSR